MQESPSQHPITPDMKEHFLGNESRHSPEAREGESRKYNTTFNRFMQYLLERTQDSPEEKREKLSGLVHDIEAKGFSYVKARMEHTRASKALQYSGTSGQAAVVEADQRRRAAHDALLDAIHIAARNVYQSSVETGVHPEEFRELLDRESGTHREYVAQTAIDYVWQQLDKEEWQERFGNHQQTQNPDDLN